jgi:signal peptidase II
MNRLAASPETRNRGQQRLLFTAIGIAVADQVAKRIVVRTVELGHSIDVLGDFFRITRTENTGAAFGLFRGGRIVFVIVSAAAAVAILFFRREIARMRIPEQVAFGLVLGGAVGNLIDRVRFGAVVDFVDLGIGDLRFAAFNLADSAISIGVAILAVHLLFLQRPGTERISSTGCREPE